MSDTESPLRISVRPEEGSSLDIVVLDVGQELPLEIERREDDPASDAIPLQFAKPQLHLIEPGAVGRRVVQVRLLMHEMGHATGLDEHCTDASGNPATQS